MATTLQLLLRLPPALRCHTLTPLPFRTLESNLINTLPRRPFTHKSYRLNPLRKPNPQKNIPRRKPPPPVRQPPKPVSQTAEPVSQRKTIESILSDYLKTNDRILLYKAPKHKTFFLNSYLLGALLTVGAVNTARNAKDEPNLKTPWLIKSLNLTVALFFAVFAATFFVAPQKMIRTVSLVKVTDVVGMPEARLRFEIKHPLPIFQRLPFIKKQFYGDSIEAPLSRIFLDRNVAAQDLSYTSVPMDQASAFTSSYFSPQPAPKRSILSRLGAFNRALVNMWPTLWQDVRRMFLRDGMAYVRITGHGNWKIDLQGAEMLDDGRPLEKVMVVDTQFDRSYWRWLKDKLS